MLPYHYLKGITSWQPILEASAIQLTYSLTLLSWVRCMTSIVLECQFRPVAFTVLRWRLFFCSQRWKLKKVNIRLFSAVFLPGAILVWYVGFIWFFRALWRISGNLCALFYSIWHNLRYFCYVLLNMHVFCLTMEHQCLLKTIYHLSSRLTHRAIET